MEIKNAIIRSIQLSFTDHGILTAWLNLEYGDDSCQAFGGWSLEVPFGANFIKRCLIVGGVDEWNNLIGKTIRVKATNMKVEAIGHITKDIWFNPKDGF